MKISNPWKIRDGDADKAEGKTLGRQAISGATVTELKS